MSICTFVISSNFKWICCFGIFVNRTKMEKGFEIGREAIEGIGTENFGTEKKDERCERVF